MTWNLWMMFAAGVVAAITFLTGVAATDEIEGPFTGWAVLGAVITAGLLCLVGYRVGFFDDAKPAEPIPVATGAWICTWPAENGSFRCAPERVVEKPQPQQEAKP